MSQNRSFTLGDWHVNPGEKTFVRLPVTRLLSGQTLSLPLHVINGAKQGPVLGLLGAIHGTEYLPIRALRQVVLEIDPGQLSGTLLVVPVANPVSFAARQRKNTPEWDVDASNANRVFPGVRAQPAFGSGASDPSDRSLSEMMVSVLVSQFFPALNALVDYHCTGMLGRAQLKIIQAQNVDGKLKEQCHGMARAFGLGLIHEHDMKPTNASGHAIKKGIPVCVPEVGGSEQDRLFDDWSTRLTVQGTLNVMRYLNMLPGEIKVPERQFVFHHAPHVRPTRGGYLISEFEGEDLVKAGTAGLKVKTGDLLGTVFSPFTFETLEELRSPVDGFLYITMRTGLVEAGDPGYAVANLQDSRWIS